MRRDRPAGSCISAVAAEMLILDTDHVSKVPRGTVSLPSSSRRRPGPTSAPMMADFLSWVPAFAGMTAREGVEGLRPRSRVICMILAISPIAHHAMADSAQADSSHSCMTAEKFVSGLKPFEQPLSPQDMQRLKRRYAPKKLERGEIGKYSLSNAMTIFVDTRPASFQRTWLAKKGRARILAKPAGLDQYISIEFKAVGYDPGDVVTDCSNVPEKSCRGRFLFFSTGAAQLGLFFDIDDDGRVDSVAVSSGADNRCGAQEADRFSDRDDLRKFLGGLLRENRMP